LGLSIVKELTSILGIRVRVESEVGSGATFILEIPRAPKDASPGE